MKVAFFILIISCNTLWAQFLSKEFEGVIKLNDSSFIPYKLHLTSTDNFLISGSSITDEGGVHETKSKIKGSYNPSTQMLNFEEYDIVYSKSPYEELDFCFVHFESKLQSFNKPKFLKGPFLGKYVDGSSCINGELLLADSKKVEKLKEKFNKPKFQEKIKLKKIDTVQLKPITNGEDLNIFVKSKIFKLKIFDSGKIDDDVINLYIDDELVLENFSIKKEKTELPLILSKKRMSVKVVAINEGTSPPNTVKIEIQSPTDFITTKTALKTNEEAVLSLIRK